MSDTNKQNPNNPPSIDDLINGEFETTKDDDFNFDELEIDSLDKDDMFAELDKDQADTANLDLDDEAFFEELNQLGNAPADTPASDTPSTGTTDITDTFGTFGTDVHTNVDTSAGTNTSSDMPINPLVDIPLASDVTGDTLADTANNTPAEPVLAAAPTKKSLFGKKDKTPADKPKLGKPAALKTGKADKGTGGISSNPKMLNYIILAAVVALALLVGAWFLSQDKSTDAPAVSATPDITSNPTPVETADTTDTEATTETATTEGEAEASEAPIVSTGETIDADAIVNAEVPEDPSLIKEEIDRLQDKDAQLKEQAQLIDEQLSMMEDLTKAKEEQIKLLEQQIAQLEQQKQ